MKTSDLKLDRYLYRKSNTTSAYEQFDDDKLTNAIEANTNRPATAVAPGTVIQSTIFQSSGSNDRVEILPNDTLVVYRDGVPVVLIDQDGISTTRTIVNKGYPQPVIIGAGFVNAAGTAGTVFPSGWTVTNIGLGQYRITHNLGTTDYAVTLTPLAGTTREFSVQVQDINFFETRFYNNATTSLTDTDHSFLLFTNP